MKVDTVVTLENNKNYLLLLKSEKEDSNYFLSVLLDEKNEPTSNYAVLKEINENNKIYIETVNNPLILSDLLVDYREQYKEEFGE